MFDSAVACQALHKIKEPTNPITANSLMMAACNCARVDIPHSETLETCCRHGGANGPADIPLRPLGPHQTVQILASVARPFYWRPPRCVGIIKIRNQSVVIVLPILAAVAEKHQCRATPPYSHASNASLSARATSGSSGWQRIFFFKYRNRSRGPPFLVGANSTPALSSLTPTYWAESAKASYDRAPAALTNAFITFHESLVARDSGSGTFSVDFARI